MTLSVCTVICVVTTSHYLSSPFLFKASIILEKYFDVQQLWKWKIYVSFSLAVLFRLFCFLVQLRSCNLTSTPQELRSRQQCCSSFFSQQFGTPIKKYKVWSKKDRTDFISRKQFIGSKWDTLRHLATYMKNKTRGLAFVYIKSLRRSSGTCVNLLVAIGNGNNEWIRGVIWARNFVLSLRQKCNRYIRDGSTSLW